MGLKRVRRYFVFFSLDLLSLEVRSRDGKITGNPSAEALMTLQFKAVYGPKPRREGPPKRVKNKAVCGPLAISQLLF